MIKQLQIGHSKAMQCHTLSFRTAYVRNQHCGLEDYTADSLRTSFEMSPKASQKRDNTTVTRVQSINSYDNILLM